jgi:preprotein translocase SecE subunit
MSKKNKVPASQVTSEAVLPEVQSEQNAKPQAINKRLERQEKNKQKTKKKEKKPNIIVKKLKETFSELKKVNWPSFSQVVKKTSVVIAVVIIFVLVIFSIDFLLEKLFDLLTSSVLS